jgi:N-acyl-D-aspartate/D-glutamate deacylase
VHFDTLIKNGLLVDGTRLPRRRADVGGEWRRVQRAKGYHYLLVNGEIVVQDDQETGVYGGALLRRRDAPALAQPALAEV